MPLHKDDPDREGNLTDAQYTAATKKLIAEQGDAGLHTVPDEVMDAAIAKAEADHDGQ